MSFVSTTASTCTVSGTTVTLVSVGACSITASQAGNASYLAAAPVAQAFNVTPWSQTLTFGPLSNVTYGSSPFAISTDTSSGLPVSLTVSTPAACKVSSAAVTIQGAGICTITASQAGDTNYSLANPIAQSFTVAPAPTNVTMTSVGSATWALVYAKVARAADGSPVNSGVVWFYDNGVLIGTGSVVGGSATAPSLTTSPGFHGYTAWFNKDGADANEAANIAPTLSLTISSSLQSQTISFSLPASAPLSTGTVALSASVSSGLGIAFTSNSATVCTVSGSTATLVAPGTCSISATQAGNANNAPVSITQTMMVGPTVLTTSLPPGVVSMPYNGTLTATGGSGGYTWSGNGLPGGLSAGTSNGVGSVSGTPLQVGTYAPVTVQVQDGAGNNRTGAILPVHLRGTQKSPTPSSLTVNGGGGGTYSGAATVASSFVFSYVSVPGTRTAETGCVHRLGDVRPCGPLVVLAPSGTVEFIDSGGTARCIISWTGDGGNTSGTLTLAGQVGQIGVDAPLTDANVCSVNPLTSSIGPPGHESSPVVGLAITFLGPTVGNTYAIQSQWTDSGYDQMSDWGNLGNWTVNAAPASTSLTSQTITFGPLSDVAWGSDPFTISATASSGLAVSFVSNTPAYCSVVGATVTPISGGTCSISAIQTGNNVFAAAATATQSFTITDYDPPSISGSYTGSAPALPCQDMTGNWVIPAGGPGGGAEWDLTQSGNIVSGTSYVNGGACGVISTQLSGSLNSDGTFTVSDGGHAPCGGYSYAPNISQISLTGNSCSNASGSDANGGFVLVSKKSTSGNPVPVNTPATPHFLIEYAAYIPVDHVAGPSPCSIIPFKTLIYLGDGFRSTYRAAQSVVWIPSVTKSYNQAQNTGATRNYSSGSPANGVTLDSHPLGDLYTGAYSGNDEDEIPSDCHLWNNKGHASTSSMLPPTLTASVNSYTAHFQGAAANPLEPGPAIDWSLDVIINLSSPGAPTVTVIGTHDCYPAHIVKVNGTQVYGFLPSSNSLPNIGFCLLGSSSISVSTQPVAVGLQ